MKRKIFTCGLIAFMSLFVSSSAFAALLNFTGNNLGLNLSATGNEYESVGMTVDGISVTVTAYTIDNDGNGNINSLTQITGAGLGVYVQGQTHKSLGVKSSSSDGYKLDGGSGANDPDEGLLFSFSEIVSLDYVNFDSFNSGSSDDFNLTVDGVLKLVDFDANHTSSFAEDDNGEFDAYLFNNIIGQEFLFWADGNTDSFKIDRLEVSAVPVPTPLVLLLTGLIGFGFAQRKIRH